MFKVLKSATKQHNSLKKYLSTNVAQEKLTIFRTNEDSPSKHSQDNVGQFYKVPAETRKQLFTHGGLPKTFHLQTKTFTETCLMVREPAVDIFNFIKTYDFSKPTPRFVVYGKQGAGKSLVLAHMLHYGLENGFFLVHVPWVGEWTRRAKNYSNSLTKEGCVDINVDAAAWLIHTKAQNAALLAREDLTTTREYLWSKRESTPKGSPLLAIIEHGINRIKYACDCINALNHEIKELSKAGKFKTMVVVDGYNAFFYPNTRVKTEKKEMVPPGRITLTEGFLELTKFDWNNGVCILSVDELAIAQEDQISHLPRYLLGKEGFEHLDPFIPVYVPEYSSKEFASCMEYYRDRKWVQPVPGMDEELKFLSSSNPYKLMQLCGPL